MLVLARRRAELWRRPERRPHRRSDRHDGDEFLSVQDAWLLWRWRRRC
jgi:hypothetical protein